MLTLEQMQDNLESLVAGILHDPGLKIKTPLSQIKIAANASRQLNEMYAKIINDNNYNADDVVIPSEVLRVSDVIHTNPRLYVSLLTNHGDDESTVEGGFHYVQNDGGTLMFRGRAFVDVVADAIYHVGFAYHNGRFVNEDGTANETARDIAGWLNYFLNGRSWVFGTSGNNELGTGTYSAVFKGAANETFDAGAGNDKIWSGSGNDKILAGDGNDESGGGTGSDQMFGGLGADKLWGETGNDRIYGEDGNDQLGGGKGNDVIDGGAGSDQIGGDEGDDKITGGAGNDNINTGEGRNIVDGGDGGDDIYCGNQNDVAVGGAGNDTINGNGGSDKISGDDGSDELSGGNGNDRISGGNGNDIISGGEGADIINAGTGVDKIEIWDNDNKADTLVFAPGDSGNAPGMIDLVNGFASGEDKIDLRAFGALTMSMIDFKGDGVASAYYDGHYLRIDVDGDRATDMMIEFSWLEKLTSADLILA